MRRPYKWHRLFVASPPEDHHRRWLVTSEIHRQLRYWGRHGKMRTDGKLTVYILCFENNLHNSSTSFTNILVLCTTIAYLLQIFLYFDWLTFSVITIWIHLSGFLSIRHCTCVQKSWVLVIILARLTQHAGLMDEAISCLLYWGIPVRLQHWAILV